MGQVKQTHDIWAILATNGESRDFLLRNLMNRDERLGNTMNIFVDPRWPLSIRVVTPKGEEPPLRPVDLFWETDQKMYDYLRMVRRRSQKP